MRSVPWIAPGDEDTPFPHPDAALDEPNGLLAIGGSLSPGRLVRAYESGIFPWFAEDQPVLWWSPDPRAIIQPGRIHVSRSLRKRLRHGGYTVSLDREFGHVIRACAEPRADGAGTWITDGMRSAYETLHAQGIAHSAEVWRDGALVGGLYGVSLGAAFFGESMFSRCNDASKIALVGLSEQLQAWGFTLIDCQLPTDHLLRLGAEEWPRHRFLDALAAALRHRQARGPWQLHGPTPLSGGTP